MKKTIHLLTILYILSLPLGASTWDLKNITYSVDNDRVFGTDDGYTSGLKLSALYDIQDNQYINISFINKIYTPTNTNTQNLIIDDRPYGGYTYGEISYIKTTSNSLDTFSLLLGTIGSSSGSDRLQNEFHRLIESDSVNGWQNQLNNELALNFRYTHKWKYTNSFYNYETSFIPFVSAELGNISVKATSGFIAKIGSGLNKDFGNSNIDTGLIDNISNTEYNSNFGYSFNILAATSFIARDIFLDGNTFSDSHSVHKKLIHAYYGLGFTLRYQNILLDLMMMEKSKEYKEQKESHGISTISLTYLF